MQTPSVYPKSSGTRQLVISVIGGSEPALEDLVLAESVGQELAKRGVVVVTGGLGGVMEAACRGAKSHGGVTIGILPGDDPSEANAYVDYAVCTGMGYARNVIVAKSGQAIIAVDGSYGTLSEIAHALGDGIPVFGLNTWELSVHGKLNRAIVATVDAYDAVEKAVQAARLRSEKTSEKMW